MAQLRPDHDARRILVVGAGGVVGRAVVERCERLGIDGLGVGRSGGPQDGLPHLALDLEDEAACRQILAHGGAFTHVVFCAWRAGPDREAEVAPNLAMLKNVLDALRETSPGLRHLTLLQGVKAYGSHLGPFRQPACETDPRHAGPNFYYAQEDHVRARAAAEGWSWTILRPVTVCGMSRRSAMSMVSVLAVLASLARARGEPLRFPGTEIAFRAERQMVDADLLARAILWSGENQGAMGEIFNVTNGDVVTWAGLWPGIAALFDVAADAPAQAELAAAMPLLKPLWTELAGDHELAEESFFDNVPWRYADGLFSRRYGNCLDTAKLRGAGFHETLDTPAMIERQFRRLAEERLIPPLGAAAPLHA
jgi:nucleoside-diphosphate-sugar epimerase